MGMEIEGRGGRMRLSPHEWGLLLKLAQDHGWVPEGAYSFRDWLVDLGLDGNAWPPDVPVMGGKNFDRTRLDPRYWENTGLSGYTNILLGDPLGVVSDEDAASFSTALARALRKLVELQDLGELPPMGHDVHAEDPHGSSSERLLYFSRRYELLMMVIGLTAACAFDVSC